jgi:hypothetical protein
VIAANRVGPVDAVPFWAESWGAVRPADHVRFARAKSNTFPAGTRPGTSSLRTRHGPPARTGWKRTEAFELAEPGQAHLLGGDHLAKANGWKNCHPRTTFEKLVKRAGLEPWPRLFHNLPSSPETELLEEFPVHVVALWIGHDAKESLKHSAQPTEEHFDRAAGGAESGLTGGAKCGAAGSGGESRRAERGRRKRRRGGELCHPARVVARS